jgi:hypothetical protein
MLWRFEGAPDAHLFEGSVTFTRTTDDACRPGRARILDLINHMRAALGQPDMPPAQVDRMVDEEVKAVRRTGLNPLRRCETIEPSR